jgi:acylphosphatase
MITRARLIVKGKVQKAGYRDMVDEVAYGHHLRGFVRNLPDGTVEIICEGEREDIEKFKLAITIDRYLIQVTGIDIDYQAPTGEFAYFDVIHDEDPTKATAERADAAARYMREMDQHIADNLTQVKTEIGEKLTQVGAEIAHSRDATVGAVVSMDNHMAGCFGGLDEKYGKFGDRLDEITNFAATTETSAPRKNGAERNS